MWPGREGCGISWPFPGGQGQAGAGASAQAGAAWRGADRWARPDELLPAPHERLCALSDTFARARLPQGRPRTAQSLALSVGEAPACHSLATQAGGPVPQGVQGSRPRACLVAAEVRRGKADPGPRDGATGRLCQRLPPAVPRGASGGRWRELPAGPGEQAGEAGRARRRPSTGWAGGRWPERSGGPRGALSGEPEGAHHSRGEDPGRRSSLGRPQRAPAKGQEPCCSLR